MIFRMPAPRYVVRVFYPKLRKIDQPCQVPRVRRGTKSDTIMLVSLEDISDTRKIYDMHTHVCIPPPPMPAIALLTTNSVKFRERPHSKQPKAKTVYAKSRQLFLPKISLNLPYNGLGFHLSHIHAPTWFKLTGSS